MDQIYDLVDGAQLQLGTAQHCLSLNYDADQVKTHIDCQGDDPKPRVLLSVGLYSVSR